MLDQRIGLRYTMSPMSESENRQLPAPPPQAGRTRGHVVLRRLPGISPVGHVQASPLALPRHGPHRRESDLGSLAGRLEVDDI